MFTPIGGLHHVKRNKSEIQIVLYVEIMVTDDGHNWFVLNSRMSEFCKIIVSEEYINQLIGDAFYHPMNKGGKGAQWLFSGGTGLIYPDFMSRESHNRIIADAKYKPVTNIGNKDYLQVLAYMFRFDAKKAYYLYPEASGSEDVVLNLNSGSSYERNVKDRDDIRLIKHGLKVPCLVNTYDEFRVEIMANELIFKQKIVTTEEISSE